MAEDQDIGNVSDGYHTFSELYEHRHALFIALCRAVVLLKTQGCTDTVWRSKLHNDGSCFDGWFIMGIISAKSQVSYHLPDRLWNNTNFAETMDRAPEWDGHTSSDVIKRISNMFLGMFF